MKKVCSKIVIMLVLVFAFTTVFPASASVFGPENISVAEAASKVKINKTKATIIKGTTVQLKISGTKKKVKWTTSDKKIAAVSSKGKVTGKGAGKATITASVGNKKYTCKVTVQAPKVSEKELTLRVDDSKRLKLTGATGNVTWTTSSKKIATVSSKGKVTGKKAGKATITAEISGKKYKCKVTVKQKKITTKFGASVTEVKMDKGSSKKIHITAADAGDISWEIGNALIATCEWDDEWDGNTVGLTIKAKKAGSTTVTITSSKNLQPIKISVVVVGDGADDSDDEISSETMDLILKAGSQKSVKIPYPGDGSINYSVGNSLVVACEWGDEETDDAAVLHIIGIAPGSTTVKVTNGANDEILVIQVAVLSAE